MNLLPFTEKLKEICRQNNVAMLGVFGSVARGEDTKESDIDLLIKLKNPIGLVEFVSLGYKFEEVLGRKVDLATENAINPKIRKIVLEDLKVIYEV
ncbi:MAG TPA: nucleotidyltransferase family protein [Pyrinomonadaceae bacterium]|nr:nucleotidyltransferase family protein [Pyrinomonadaceae bacterium]